MLRDGTYAVWFKTPLAQGTGIAHLADGQVWGRDAVMTFRGSCQVDGDRFTATIATKRHTEGLDTVFGTKDELTLTLVGMCVGKTATYVGTAEQFPGVLMEGTLIFNEEQSGQAGSAEPVAQSDRARLPKLPKRFR